MAVSTRNPLHLLAGANDYRTVDLPLNDVLPNSSVAGDAWLGLFKSFNGGATWQSTLLPGYPQDQTAEGLASPLKGFTTASDPVVRAGTNGLFHYVGIAFNRNTNKGVIFVSQLIDLNNKENGNAAPSDALTTNTDPIRYVRTVAVDSATGGQFLDKPWIAVDIPRPGAVTCHFAVSQPGQPGGTVTQSFAGGNVYLAYTKVTSNAQGVVTSSQIFFSRSVDCGATWSTPVQLSTSSEGGNSQSLNQGATIAIDPPTGFVYVAWRRFRTLYRPDSIMGTASLFQGRFFLPAIPIVTLPAFDPTRPTAPSFFDQGTTGTSARTNAFPALAVDGGRNGFPGRIYLAWSQRGAGPNGEARIMMLTSPDINHFPPVPFAIDNGPLTELGDAVVDNNGAPLTRGHQFMPQMTFVGGKLMVLYYDLRQDQTFGVFTPNSNFPLPDIEGRFYEENRQITGDLAASGAAKVFTPFMDDFGLTVRRHTLDVVVAQSNGGATPAFTTARVSQYKFGLRNDGHDMPDKMQQLQVNPPNLPLFKGGTVPFLGDYIDIAGLMFVLRNGSWRYNAAPSRGPVHFAAWTTNQDVRPPFDLDWTKYTPVGTGGGPSTFDPSQTRPVCETGREGMRNQNIYSSRITQGLLVSSPQNAKPLSTTLQRAFVVFVQNFTNSDRSFRLTIANQPPGGRAAFVAVPNNPVPNPIPPAGLTETTLDVSIAAHSGITRPVFALSSSPTASVTINVDEISGPTQGLVPNGLSSFVVLNADGTTPALINPDGTSTGDIASVEIYNPNISNPNISNPNISNPNISNPNISNPNISNPNISNPNISNPDITDPNIANPNISNPNIANPNISNPNISNPNISNTSVSDATYTVGSDSNTHTSYNVKLVQTGELPSNAQFQLVLNKTYSTPVGLGCELREESQNILLSNIVNPAFLAPGSDLTNPNISNPNISNATFELGPGETALLTLRGNNVDIPTMTDIVTNKIVPVVGAQAVNTNSTTGTPVITVPGGISIFPPTLPDGTAGLAYPTTILQAIGGTPPYTWSLAFESSLPPGLSLQTLENGSAQISGTPTTAGTFPFTIQVTDSSVPAIQGQRSYTIVVVPPPDLVVESLSHAPPAPTTTDLITFTAVVRNIGAGPAGASTLLFAIGGETPGAEGTLFAVPALGPGQSFMVQRQRILDVAQAYRNTATADSTNVVFESNETNNTTTDDYSVVVPAPPPPVTVFTGTAGDATGDACTTCIANPPDLVFGSVIVNSNGNVQLSVRFAPNTFNPQTSSAEFLLDTDQNPATGSPGVDSGGSDSALMGSDYLVVLDSGFNNNQATIYKATGGLNQFAVLGTAPVTVSTNGMDVTFPLSMLVNTASGNTSGPATSGPWNFKVTDDASIGPGIFTSALDYMPNLGLAPGTTAGPAACGMFPTGFVPFTTVRSVARDTAGDAFIVGGLPPGAFSELQYVPLPSASNQQFCNPVMLETNFIVPAYVPTAAERIGDFSGYAGLTLIDPLTGEPFPGNLIPASRLDTVFVWRIPPHSATLPKYACSLEPTLHSIDGIVTTSIQFTNSTAGAVNVYWINYQGQRVLYFGGLGAGQSFVQQTFITHPWIVTDAATGTCLGIWLPTESPGTAIIGP